MGEDMHRIRLIFALIFALTAPALSAHAQSPETPPPERAVAMSETGMIETGMSEDETAIRALLERWYAEHRAGKDGYPRRLQAPGVIDASPGYFHPATQSAAASPAVYNSLAHTAHEFRHEISSLDIDTRYAKARVYERGYSFAWAAQRTYERLGTATFVLEKQDDGRWLVLAHQTYTMGIPPNLKTDPMPDLRDLFYSTIGKDRDREADALAAGRF